MKNVEIFLYFFIFYDRLIVKQYKYYLILNFYKNIKIYPKAKVLDNSVSHYL